ncbi:MAG: STAS domain-containing protein [Actinomycetota bacterium]|nr:STAS domain-containing protein [Actinomycetota bacterium]
MKVEVEEKSGFTVVSVVGELDVYTVPLFRKVLLKLEGARKHNLIVDLSKLTFLDSSGLGALIEIYQKIQSAQGEIVFILDNPRILRVFELVNLDKVLTIHPNLGRAFQHVGAPSGYVDEEFFSDIGDEGR